MIGHDGFAVDATYLAPRYCAWVSYELYDGRHDVVQARDYYSRFVDPWKDAAAGLPPKVTGAKTCLPALGGEPQAP